MKLKEWGESNVVNFLAKEFSVLPPLVGIGDDCAVIPLNKDENLLITVDALTENIHFLSSIAPEDLGYKSVMVNVSDIASMGGTAEHLFLAHALPAHIDVSWLQSFYSGFKEACEKTGVTLLGGDTVGSKESIFLSITAVGRAKKAYTKYRSQAKIGDLVCVTGLLSESPVGLKCLLNGEVSSTLPEVIQLIKSHTRPEAHFRKGPWLGQYAAVHAMADVSDGIAQDLSNIMRASNVGGIINIDQLPISPLAKKICVQYKWDPEYLSLFGGEEYCLILTIAPEAYLELSQKFENVFNQKLYSIGEITETKTLEYLKDKKTIKIGEEKFDHFKSAVNE